MPTISIKFRYGDGREEILQVATGGSVMEKAITADIDGIEAKCRGSCSCVTCHVWVEDGWFKILPEMTEMESSTLDYAADFRSVSRLSCQIEVTDKIDGIVMSVPERQRIIGLL